MNATSNVNPVIAVDPLSRKSTVRVVACADESAERTLPEANNASNGDARTARDATILNAAGEPVPASIVGTKAQWACFSGVTCEGTYAYSKSLHAKLQAIEDAANTGVTVDRKHAYAWFFSPVAGSPVYNKRNEF